MTDKIASDTYGSPTRRQGGCISYSSLSAGKCQRAKARPGRSKPSCPKGCAHERQNGPHQCRSKSRWYAGGGRIVPGPESLFQGGNMLTQPLFRDRIEAGRILGQQVKAAVREPHPVVLALPRGGVPVAFEVAQALHADLDIFLVRKLGVPGHEELAMGAIASGGGRVLNHEIIRQLGISTDLIERVTRREQQEIARRETLYREGRPALPVSGRTVVL